MSLTADQIAEALQGFGCPPAKCAEMASQLDKRAGQLAVERGTTRDEALAHLLRLMAGGWAAQGRNKDSP